MSYFIFEYNKHYEINRYLEEVFKPKKVDYGVNFLKFNDKNFVNINGLIITLSKIKNSYFLLALGEDNEIGFTVVENIEKYDNIEDIIDNEYNIKSSNNNAIIVFNSIFYIYLELMKKYNLRYIQFTGATKALQDFYEKLLDNKNLIRYLDTLNLSLFKKDNYIILKYKVSWKEERK